MTPEDTPIPHTAYELIELLDRTIPHRCIQQGESVEAAHRYAGHRELVDELVAWMTEEKERAVEGAE